MDFVCRSASQATQSRTEHRSVACNYGSLLVAFLLSLPGLNARAHADDEATLHARADFTIDDGMHDTFNPFDNNSVSNRLFASLGVAPAQAAVGGDPGVEGQWSDIQTWPIVAVHAALMPDGRVVAYDSVGDAATETFAVHNFTRATIWDPTSNVHTRIDNLTGYNMFCSGLAHLPDGRLFLAGGNKNAALEGITQTHYFDTFATGGASRGWTLGPTMAAGRWYPSVTTLANGEILITSGTPTVPEVLTTGGTLRSLNGAALSLPLYPWTQVAPNGDVVYLGPDQSLRNLTTSGAGSWSTSGQRDAVNRSYGSHVLYDVGKALVTGGGPSATSSVIVDLNTNQPTSTGAMAFGRRQHNVTVLADGSVLATGGNSIGSEFVSFTGAVYNAEMWTPATGQWSTLARMQVTRQYHSTALLLPDGRVLSAGGGLCGDCTRLGYLNKNAEVFSPPYLFMKDGSGTLAPRPTITSAPSRVGYGQIFQVATPQAPSITKAALVRLSAVTHSVNYDQRYIPLVPRLANNGIELTAPATPNLAPPGYYMLFILDNNGVPSIAKMVQITAVVDPSNRAPVLTSPGDQVTNTGTAVNLAVIGTDADNDRLTYSAMGLPAGLSINSATGVISGNANTAGVTATTITVADGRGGTASVDFSWTVSVTGLGFSNVVGGGGGVAFIDQPAANQSLTNVTVRTGWWMDSIQTVLNTGALPARGGTGGLAQQANVPANDYINAVTLKYGTYVSQITFKTAGGSTFGPFGEGKEPSNVASPNTVTLAAPQGFEVVGFQGRASSYIHALGLVYRQRSVTTPTNRDPTIVLPPTQTTNAGQAVNLPISASDPDGDPLTFSATGMPGGLIINAATGVITGTPTVAGAYRATITVSDGKGGTANANFSWAINAVTATATPTPVGATPTPTPIGNGPTPTPVPAPITAVTAIVGSAGGTPFSDQVGTTEVLTGVNLRAAWWLDSIQGLTNVGALPNHGGTGGLATQATLQANEYIVSATVTFGSYVSKVAFTTSNGRNLGPFGDGRDSSGNPSTNVTTLTVPAGHEVIGFTGRAATYLNALGLISRQRVTGNAAPTATPSPTSTPTATQAPIPVATPTPTLTPTPVAAVATPTPTPAPATTTASAIVGSAGGTPFTDQVAATQLLTGVNLRTGWWLDSIQGLTNAGALPNHGGTGGLAVQATLQPNEYIVSATVTYGSYVSKIVFTTNTGRSLGPYGEGRNSNGTASPSTVTLTVPAGNQVIGFTGRASTYLNAVGLLSRPRTSVVAGTVDVVPPASTTALSLAPLSAAPQTVGTVVNYQATATGGVNPRFSWAFGDGSAPSAPASSAAASHTFTAPGRYTVAVTASDDGGTTVTRQFVQAVHWPLTATAGRSSMSVAVDPGTKLVWSVNPDNDSVARVDPVSGQTSEIQVGREPRSIARAPDGRWWVTNHDSDTVSIITPNAGQVVQTITLPRGAQPYGIVFDPRGTAAYVAMEGRGQVARIEAISGTVSAIIAVGARPRHLSVEGSGTRLLVSRYVSPPLPGEASATPQTVDAAGNPLGGEVLVVDTSGASFSPSAKVVLQHSEAPDTPASAHGIPNYLGPAVISPDGRSAWVPSKQDNVLRGERRNGIGLTFETSVRAISSRIDLGTLREDLAQRIDHDNSGVASTALFDPSGNYLFVALETTREVAVVDPYNHQELLRFNAGRAPQGLALAPDGLTLYVQNFMDRTITAHDVSSLTQQGVAQVTPLGTFNTVASEKLTPAVLLGKQLFYDAKDPRLARDGYLSCASCHNEGSDDGRVWDLSTFGEGLRNTISLQGHAGMAQGRLHWTGNFDEVQDFEAQIRNFARGTGLMDTALFTAGTRSEPLGAPKAGLSVDLDALAAYVSSLNALPPSPFRDTSGQLTAPALQGQALFSSKQCDSCHQAPLLTDSVLTQDIRHDVGSIKPTSGTRLNQPLTGLDTPTLYGLWLTPPFLHDGSAGSLQDALFAHSLAGFSLNAQDADNLAAYLLQLEP